MNTWQDVWTIDDVVGVLDDIVESNQRDGNRLGIFPALYRKTTARIKEGIASGRFEDGERMERLDVFFARRYLDAYYHFRRGEMPTAAWLYAFRMARREYPLILQHLLLGINAHINLDLCIAAYGTVPGDEMAGLHYDFNQINDVLSELMDEVQAGLAQVSPLVRTLDALAGEWDELVTRTALLRARRLAWRRATYLARTHPDLHGEVVARFDLHVSRLARRICPPDRRGQPVFRRVREAESKDVEQIIEVLK